MLFEFQRYCPFCGGYHIRFKKESLLEGYMITKCLSCREYFHMKFGRLGPKNDRKTINNSC